jgi:hypothetical protein
MAAITKAMLRDYLHDALPDAEMASVEAALRSDAKTQALFNEVQQDLDRGEHSIGAIWRRERLSCPSRDQIGSYLLQALDEDLEEYIEFHLKTIGCPACQANLEDLEKKKAKADKATAARHSKIVNSSSPALKKARKA